jgi:hypothetical protein
MIPVACHHPDRRKFGDEQTLPPLNAIHTHLIIRQRKAFGELHSAGNAVVVDVVHGGEHTWRRIGHWWLPRRQQSRRYQPKVHEPDAADDQDRQGKRKHAELCDAQIRGDRNDEQIG